MKYAFIQQHRGELPFNTLLRVLDVSRSGYHDWTNRREIRRRAAQRNERDAIIRRCFLEQKSRYGAPRLAVELREQGYHWNVKTIANSLKRQQLRAIAGKKFRPRTTDSDHQLPVYENVLKQDFSATAPNQKWVQDITYIRTTEGWLYLAVVIDLYSRLVVGWAMSRRMHSSLVCDALYGALARRGHPEGVTVHSDRGSQYCSKNYRQLLKKYHLVGSMSAKGCCYDNACAESFFHSLKVELLYGEPLMSRQQTRQNIFRYIEVDYNRKRRHSACSYLSPECYEKAS